MSDSAKKLNREGEDLSMEDQNPKIMDAQVQDSIVNSELRNELKNELKMK